MNKKFILMGVGGYIAPRHLRAIKDTGNTLLAALDKNDSVGILDSYFPTADFFTEFERLDRYVEKNRRKNNNIDYVSICSPNYLHDAHVRFALRIGAEAICEKPLVINPWNIDALRDIQSEQNKKINTILQLRLHPSIVKLKEKIDKEDKIYDVDLTYITSRGKWYDRSWKGDMIKSGGIIYNIGIHFFDMLLYLFGEVEKNIVHVKEERRSSGYLELKKAKVRWFLSLNDSDLSLLSKGKDIRTYRSICVNNDEIEFSKGFTDLHTESYKKILNGDGFGLDDVSPSIELASNIKNLNPIGLRGERHPILLKIKEC
jgi:UDP-N-acetyl-2-amino-2-deoxyglucuronate dehydrogenase